MTPSTQELEKLKTLDLFSGIGAYSLGLKSSKKPYRNHFAASPGHSDMPLIESLIAAGAMIAGRTERSGMTFYHVTDAGCRAVGTTREAAER